MGQKVTMYTLDEVTWSTNPEEPLQLLSRQEEGRSQLQAKVQAVPKEKTPVAARAESIIGLVEDEPFGADDEELKEDEVDDIEIDVELDDLDEEDDIPVKGKALASGSKKAFSKEVFVEELKKIPLTPKPGASPLKVVAPSKEKEKPGREISTKVDKTKVAKGKVEQKTSQSKPVKSSSTSAKKIEAPQKGKAVNVKVSPSKGKSPKKKG